MWMIPSPFRSGSHYSSQRARSWTIRAASQFDDTAALQVVSHRVDEPMKECDAQLRIFLDLSEATWPHPDRLPLSQHPKRSRCTQTSARILRITTYISRVQS